MVVKQLMFYATTWLITRVVNVTVLRRVVLFTGFSIISLFSLLKMKERSPL
jgi:hypothetical protein